MKVVVAPTKTHSNTSNKKWYELFNETPKDRARRTQIYIDICNACWKKQA